MYPFTALGCRKPQQYCILLLFNNAKTSFKYFIKYLNLVHEMTIYRLLYMFFFTSS